MEQEDGERRAKNFALKRLSRRALLTQELGLMLHKAGFSQEIVETILQWCQKRGYLNDVEEIRRRVEKEQKKGVGKKAIFFKLSKKEGIDRALLEASLKELLSEKKVLM